MTRNELFSSNSIQIYNDWIIFLNDYELKLMVFLSFHSNSKGIFTGNLTRICNFLNVKSNTTTNKKIKEAIFSLEKRGFLEQSLERKEWTIKVHWDAMIDNPVNFKKQWIKELMNYNYDAAHNKIDQKISISWIKILRVFAYTYINTTTSQLITSKRIAACLGINDSTVDEAFKAISNCHFEGLTYEKRVQRSINDQIIQADDGTQTIHRTYRTEGSIVEYGINLLELEVV